MNPSQTKVVNVNKMERVSLTEAKEPRYKVRVLRSTKIAPHYSEKINIMSIFDDLS